MISIRERRQFNPSNTEDLKAYKHFIDHGKWEGGCPFVIEWPWGNVPAMIQTKILDQYYDDLLTLAQRQNKTKKGRYVAPRV